jgi:hypothetical protein
MPLRHDAPGRGRAHPRKSLAGYRGRFRQGDACQSCDALTAIARDGGPWRPVYCWTHVRRRFVKRFENARSPIAEAMLRRIALLHPIERTLRGKKASLRPAARRDRAAPVSAARKPWPEAQLARIPQQSRPGRGHPIHARRGPANFRPNSSRAIASDPRA